MSGGKTSNLDSATIERLLEGGLISGGEFHESIGSTNDRAIELIKQGGFDAPYLILAGEQTAGRGRGANTWWSAPGALTLTLIVDPSLMGIAPARFGLASLASALAIAAAARSRPIGEAVRLKWPNDVFLAGRKLAGVLVEVPPLRPQRLAIGMGVNVNNSFVKAPESIAKVGIALCDEIGGDLSIEEVLAKLLGELTRRLHSMTREAENIVAEFREHCLLTGRQVTIIANDEPISGYCRGIDDQGALRIETHAGERRCFGGVVKKFE